MAVVAPAGPFDRALFDAGLAMLAQRYQPRLLPDIGARDRYLAGDDARRQRELNAALTDPEVKAVFTARGGYGSMRLLPGLPRALPRPLVGFSDITALHQVLQRDGLVSVHGPVLTQLGRQSSPAVERLFRLLESTELAAPLSGITVVPGVAEGPLRGGNLSVLTRLLGTPYLPPLQGAILLLEDVGERPYQLDRMWTHLALAGVFTQVRGLALGSFTACEEKDADYTSVQVLERLAAQVNLPCVRELSIGHDQVNLAVPLGARVRLDATAATLHFLEPAVEAHR